MFKPKVGFEKRRARKGLLKNHITTQPEKVQHIQVHRLTWLDFHDLKIFFARWNFATLPPSSLHCCRSAALLCACSIFQNALGRALCIAQHDYIWSHAGSNRGPLGY